eukprot:13501528-Alexandrium_andersonii.AAC.1
MWGCCRGWACQLGSFKDRLGLGRWLTRVSCCGERCIILMSCGASLTRSVPALCQAVMPC